jgi:hypothetical protein
MRGTLSEEAKLRLEERKAGREELGRTIIENEAKYVLMKRDIAIERKRELNKFRHRYNAKYRNIDIEIEKFQAAGISYMGRKPYFELRTKILREKGLVRKENIDSEETSTEDSSEEETEEPGSDQQKV